MSIYRFIAAERAAFDVKMLCSHLGVSTSAFYDWCTRPPSRREVDNRALTRRIGEIHEASRGTYGAPRICAELRAEGLRITRKRVARLMRLARVQGVHIRRPLAQGSRRARTRPRPRRPPVPDHSARSRLGRRHHLDPHRRRMAAPGGGRGSVLPRRIVGWSMASHLRAELVIDAVQMAIANRHPGPGLVHHSDQGPQFTSFALGRKLRESEILASMGAVGTAYDNAVAESFFSTLKRELCHRGGSRRGIRLGRRSSSSSRSSTTVSDATRRSGWSRRHSSNGTTLVRSRHSRTCPANGVKVIRRRRQPRDIHRRPRDDDEHLRSRRAADTDRRPPHRQPLLWLRQPGPPDLPGYSGLRFLAHVRRRDLRLRRRRQHGPGRERQRDRLDAL